jgi:hypothetical protein
MRSPYRLAAGALFLGACNGDFQFVDQPHVPPAEPPGQDADPLGEPPDWQNCFQGWRARYINLSVHDEFVAPRPTDDPAPTDPDGFDYWVKQPAYEDVDVSIDFGENWWPVDEGLEGDPAYFAVYWDAWIRADNGTYITFQLGSEDDAWVYIDGREVVANPGIHPYERLTYDTYLEAGPKPIEVWFAHRGSENSGFSLRLLTPEVDLCYPEFE